MNKSYRYEVAGTGGNGQTWKAEGKVECQFAHVFGTVIADAFGQLTGGRAVFGKPGVGCNGPYDVDRILIEQVSQ